MMPFKKNLPAAGSGFSNYYVPEEKFLGPPSPKNLATPLPQSHCIVVKEQLMGPLKGVFALSFLIWCLF